MTRGVKSKYFGAYWQSMFMSALAFPEKAPSKATVKKFKQFYDSFKYVIPCCFCRDFIRDTLEKDFPLDFSGKIPLIRSIYLWKDAVNNKLINQGCVETKPSPPFETILKRLERKYAKCNKSKGKCE